MRPLQEINTIRKLDYDLAMFMDQLHSRKAYEHSLMIPDHAHHLLCLEEFENLALRVRNLDDTDEVVHFLIHHFNDVLDTLDWECRQFFTHPQTQLHQLLETGFRLTHYDQRRPSIRKQILNDQWSNLPACLDAVCKTDLSLNDQQSYASGCQQLLDQLAEIEKDWLDPEISSRAAAALTNTMKDLPEPLAVKTRGMDECLDTDPEEYRAMLQQRMGIDLDDLLSWYKDQIEYTRNRVYELANELSETPVTTMEQVRQLLDEKAGACDSAEEMFRRGREYLDRVRKVSKEKLWSPVDEICDLTTVPEELRDSYPWGGYMDGCPYERPLHGRMFLNETNYTAVSDGWIKINTVHEAYFGHHIQFLRINSDPIPETMCRNIKADPIIEGTAHRSEHVYESIFPEDPYYPLFTAYRRHHTSVRIQADLMLRWENRPIREAVRLYQNELGFDEKTARGQVLAQENMFGYFTCYCYGLKKIEQLEKELDIEKDEMTRLLFDCGQISISSLELFLKCSPQSRWSITHDFPSLMRFA